ncbi:MAG: DUF1294 domain-containing protein [Candidatus Absconditabacterales bacterium]
MNYFIYYLIVINVVTFVLRGVDKRKATRGDFRIPENILLLCVGLGGAAGAVFGMNYFRHKRAKGEFLWKLWLIVLVRLALAIAALLYG